MWVGNSITLKDKGVEKGMGEEITEVWGWLQVA